MSETAVEVVPADFERLPEGLGFMDSLQPSYRREPHGDLGIDYISSARQYQVPLDSGQCGTGQREAPLWFL